MYARRRDQPERSCDRSIDNLAQIGNKISRTATAAVEFVNDKGVISRASSGWLSVAKQLTSPSSSCSRKRSFEFALTHSGGGLGRESDKDKRIITPESPEECGLSCSEQPSKKLVRFATNLTTGEVSPTIIEFPKAPSELRDQLWWTSTDFHNRYEQDREMVADVKDCYRSALRVAYDSIQRPYCSKVDLNFQALRLCSSARGMESSVMPEIGNFVKGHSRAVLYIQELARANNKNYSWNESTMKVFRLLSLKYSRCSRLVAAKMGECDQQISLETNRV